MASCLGELQPCPPRIVLRRLVALGAREGSGSFGAATCTGQMKRGLAVEHFPVDVGLALQQRRDRLGAPMLGSEGDGGDAKVVRKIDSRPARQQSADRLRVPP